MTHKEAKSFKVLWTMELLFHLIPGTVLFIFGLFTSDDYVAMGVYWLILGVIPVFIVYNIIAFLFGLDRVFPFSVNNGGDDYYSPCNDPNNMYYDPGCPESPYYEEDYRW